MMVRIRMVWLMVVCAIGLFPAGAVAQDGWRPFISGFGGGSLIPAFTVAVTDPSTASGLDIAGRKVVNSAIGGASIGTHRTFNRVRLGFRVDGLRQNTNAEAQMLQAMGTLGGRPYQGPFPAPAGTGSASFLTGSVIAGWDLPAARLTPYAGIGGGINRASIKLAGVEGKDTAGLVLALAGVEVSVNSRVAVFGEYRFARAEYNIALGPQNNVFTAKPSNIVAGVTVALR